MYDSLALAVQVGEGASAHLLRLEGQGLAGLEALGAAVEAVGAGLQLLALLEVGVAAGGRAGLVAEPAAEQGGPVVGEPPQPPVVAVHVSRVVADAPVAGRPRRRRYVLLLQLHLPQQLARLHQRPLRRAERRLARLPRQLRHLV